jgi:hypothetical protein
MLLTLAENWTFLPRREHEDSSSPELREKNISSGRISNILIYDTIN